MAIDSSQFRNLIVRPTLRALEPEIPYSEVAVELLMLTAATESLMGEYIAQVKGPALGVYQMEPTTHDDIWKNFLKYNRTINRTIEDAILGDFSGGAEGASMLVGNLYYATAMARVHYFRVKEPLPDFSFAPEETTAHVFALAAYWKTYYNTEKGKGNILEAVKKYKRYAT